MQQIFCFLLQFYFQLLHTEIENKTTRVKWKCQDRWGQEHVRNKHAKDPPIVAVVAVLKKTVKTVRQK